MKIDLHTHSIASPDGGLTMKDYDKSPLNFIAITDHNRIDFALSARKKLGSKIIVGEEIMTRDTNGERAGEIIGLFLTRKIKPGLTPRETCKLIKKQNGVVYIPHPFSRVRSGISPIVLESIAGLVDVIECVNGRAYFDNHEERVRDWAAANSKVIAASSDAHGLCGWGKTFSYNDSFTDTISNTNIVHFLSLSSLADTKVGIGIVYPKLQRIRKRLKKAHDGQ